ncbi:MAG TPA: hypothetical protein VFV37_11635 [Luteibaculaceae bacterium]|jgi:hypothetical protein|nr:hypothetical protein [Luteibaculaceae bacterium]
MKKVAFLALLGVFALGSTAAFAGGKEKGKKSKTECTKAGEKKACCSSKAACAKPGTAPKAS